jgi:hypothetical protein
MIVAKLAHIASLIARRGRLFNLRIGSSRSCRLRLTEFSCVKPQTLACKSLRQLAPEIQALPPGYLFPVGVLSTQCVSRAGVGGITLPIPIDRCSPELPTGCQIPPCGHFSPVLAFVPAGNVAMIKSFQLAFVSGVI